MEQQIPVPPPQQADDEIDLIALAKTLWSGRKKILYSILAGIILGLFIALLSPKEYTVSTVMVPQLGDSQNKLGGLSSLAAMAGVNIDMSQGSDLSPMVYPQIVNSIPYRIELMNTPLDFKGFTKPVTLFDYFIKYKKSTALGSIKKYTIGLPGVILKTIKGKPQEMAISGDSLHNLITLSYDQTELLKTLGKMVSLELNSKEGYITLTAKLSEPLATAQLAQKAQDLLQRYITEFKIEKAKANLDFIQGRYDETKTEFEKAQVSLAVANDRKKNFTSALPQIETDRIQTKYTIAFSVFQELAKQLEQAKIQVKKDTPIFTIVEPVTVPTEKSKPKRAMILAIWLFLGVVAGVGIVFGEQYLVTIKKRWKEEKE
jgi:LPS O-antigen subunit length determinant protein (WzzB/FepE family)